MKHASRLVIAPLALLLSQASASKPIIVAGLDNPLTEDQSLAEAKNAMDTESQLSYAVGWDIGESFVKQGFEFNLDHILAGLGDALQKKDKKLTHQQYAAAMEEFKMRLQVKQKELLVKLAERSAEESARFLNSNAKKEGVKVSESGLQIEVIRAGQGDAPQPGAKVSCHYEGRLVDGRIFDSTYKKGAPATFSMKTVIPGWQEALLKMREGAKYRVVMPPELAYGDKGAGTSIPPNSTLIFEIELLDVL